MKAVFHLAAGGCMLILAAATADWDAAVLPLMPEAGGCCLAALNALAAAAINRSAVGREARSFWRWAGGWHSLRVVLFVGAMLAALQAMPARAPAFIAAAFIGYFCFMAAEIAALHRRSGARAALTAGASAAA